MEKKYKTEPEGDMLRIIALKDFSDVKKGDKGGLIAAERNLSQEGDCWVYENAKVGGYYGYPEVSENAKIRGNAKVTGFVQVYGNAVISDNAIVSESAEVYGNAYVCGNAWVHGAVKVYGNAHIEGNARIYGDVKVYGNAHIEGNARIYGDVKISGTVKLWCWSCNTITTSIENNKDYIILGNNRGEFHIYSSKIENITNITATARNYIKNIQTIRQIYLTPNF
jgi:carbonic anhydrase/acetyltransferase-like protein (isoleucine patch superfamily)